MKVAKIINSIITFIIFSSLIIMPADIQASNIESDNSTLEVDLLEIASAAIYSELDALVDNQVQASSTNGIDSALYADGIQENILFNQGLKNYLLSHGQRYVNYSTDIQPISFDWEDDTVELKVKEIRTLGLSNDADMIADIETSYVQKHILKFEYDADTWRLVQDIEIDAFAESTIPENDEDWEPALDGGLLNTELLENTTYLPLIFSDMTVNTDNSINAASVDKTTGVDRDRVRDYAETYALNYNSDYKSFESDCTNFVSQALKHGGWDEVNGMYWSNHYWWYNRWNQSRSWAGAHNLWWFIYNSERGSLASWNQMRIGDVMMFDWHHDYHIDHTVIVTSKENDTPFLTYHSRDTLNISIWDFAYRVNEANGRYPYYWGWKLN